MRPVFGKYASGNGVVPRMLQDLIRQHTLEKAILQRQSEAATQRAVKAAESLSADLVEVANSGAAKAFQQQQRIGVEVEKVLSLTNKLSDQNTEWATMINSADQALRVLGDFQTYFEVLQQDMSKLTSSLQHLGQQTAPQQQQQL
ncbi:TPA: biogenesis of lysosome- organelles complex 1 subunit 1 [Trebouxia sp. C0005]